MIINHNITALNTHRQMASATSAQASSMEKLSSGMRINSAKDDAAGLSISEKMRGQIRGLEQASANAQDGISLMQTAEGALNETHDILQRMRELSVQSANDTNTTDDRAEIQKEMDQLTSEIDRIGNNTEFNSKKLLNGGANVAGTSAVAGTSIVGGSGDTKVGASLTLTGTTAATAATATRGGAFVAGVATAGSLSINGTTFDIAAGETNTDVAKRINDAGLGVNATFTGTDLTLTTTATGSAAVLESDAAASGTIAKNTGADASIAGAGETFTSQGDIVTITSGDAKGLQLKVTADGGTGDIDVTNNGTLNLQIGSNENQELNFAISDMRAGALGVSGLNVTSQTTAKGAITTIDAAIKSVSSERSKLGATQNRLEHTINNLNTSAENLTSAESRIRDVDYAEAA